MDNFHGTSVCNHCSGRGYTSFEIDVREFINVVDEGLSADNKIVAIKAVRTRWGMGLKDAKEMVEAFQEFLKGVATITARH